MDDEFRLPLERRIASLRSQRDLVQDVLRERHRELNSVDRRIEAAEELYRQEFDAEPPSGTDGTEQKMRRATKIRRTVPGQLPWKDTIIEVLRDAGTPLHAKEIWRRMSESGFQSDAVDPVRSVVATAIRSQDAIHREGPNTFALNDQTQASLQQGLLG